MSLNTARHDEAPTARELVALARARLREELRALPPEGSRERWERLTTIAPQPLVSRGALVWAIRVAMSHDDLEAAQALFVILLRRIDGLNGQWLRRTLATGVGASLAGDQHDYANDLMHDLTLVLWEHIVWRDDEAWELFFGRALAYAQSHVAEAWGRRVRRNAALPLSGLSRALGRLEQRDDADATQALAEPAGPEGVFAAADLADLRLLVTRLPERERVAVTLRFWQGASEETIAAALGGVTTRTVRNVLKRAYTLLSAWYSGDTPPVSQRSAGGDDTAAEHAEGEEPTNGE